MSWYSDQAKNSLVTDSSVSEHAPRVSTKAQIPELDSPC